MRDRISEAWSHLALEKTMNCRDMCIFPPDLCPDHLSSDSLDDPFRLRFI